jgi:hypothetical protein
MLTCSILATSPPRASGAPSTGEARARAVVQAFSAGDPQGLERAARENYSAAALARRTPDQRAQSLKRVFGETGALEITGMKTEANTLVATTKAARGGVAVFTFLLGAAPEQRIENVSVQIQGGSGEQPTEDPYKPYAFLIGEWESTGGIRQSLRWGSQKTYIWYSVYMRPEGAAEEQLHQEGMMTFNGHDKSLDFLFVHPGTLSQEQGKVHVEADGTIVRETTAISGGGTLTYFRQTWRQTGPNAAITGLLRKKDDGTWEPTFPGADKLAMTRRPS